MRLHRSMGHRLQGMSIGLALFQFSRDDGGTQEGDDFPESAQGSELFGPCRRSLGKSVVDRREDLNSLDGVDAEIGVEPHVQLEHVGWIACFVRDDLQQEPRSTSRSGLREQSPADRLAAMSWPSGRGLADEVDNGPESTE